MSLFTDSFMQCESSNLGVFLSLIFSGTVMDSGNLVTLGYLQCLATHLSPGRFYP